MIYESTLTAHEVWRRLQYGKPIPESARSTKEHLLTAFDYWVAYYTRQYNQARLTHTDRLDRKHSLQTEYAEPEPLLSLLYSDYDAVSEYIWKKIEPDREERF